MDRKFAVADHDFTKFSFSPSVHFIIDIPEDIEGSFYTGIVNVGLKENAFQASSSPRHATELCSLLKHVERKPMLVMYTDGGPDHNPTFLRTQLSLIALSHLILIYCLQSELLLITPGRIRQKDVCPCSTWAFKVLG
jgi:hypothetical protein